MNFVVDTFNTIYSSVIFVIATFLPKFIAGLTILIIGIVIASLVRDLIRVVFRYLRLDRGWEGPVVLMPKKSKSGLV